MIAELVWLAGAAAQTFAPGGKHSRAATGLIGYIELSLVYLSASLRVVPRQAYLAYKIDCCV